VAVSLRCTQFPDDIAVSLLHLHDPTDSSALVCPHSQPLHTCSERRVLETERRMQYLALKERLKETLKEEAVAEISLPGEELDDSQQFEYIQAKVREKLRVVVTFSFLSSRCTSLR
jgi:hypothetical protein